MRRLAARGRTLRFYRHPFLFTGPTPEIKKGMQAFLDAQGYRVAPVTLDNADYQFAALYTRPQYRERVREAYVPYMESIVAFFEQRSIEVVGREFPQILLLHANELNADLMPDLLAMFRRRGYTFVSARAGARRRGLPPPRRLRRPQRLLVDPSLVADVGHAAQGRTRPAGLGEEAMAAR